MTPDAFRHLVDQVREKTDLADLIGEQVSLSPTGSVLKGRSPWNKDTDPSFVVWPATQTWRDFSGRSDAGGDCFDWLQKHDGVDFMSALRKLAVRAGVDVPGSEALKGELERLSERHRVSALLTSAAAYYHQVLPTKIRQAWLRDHYGFTAETIDHLLLGWADGHLFQHMTGLLGATREEALSTGLFVQLADGRVEDFFRGRLVFPYWSRGKVVYFIARSTEHTGKEPWEQAKYKKLLTRSERHSYVSPAVANDTLYNEDAARGAEDLLITEGVTDCISAMQAGLAVVSPVTVRFRRQDHPRLLDLTRRARRVVICNDSEVSGAGEAGALETAQALHAAGRDVRIATIPMPAGATKIDVNELVKSQGPDALKKVVRLAKRLPEFLLERIPADVPKSDLALALEPVLEMLRVAQPIEREACLELVQTRFGLKRRVLKELLKRPDQRQSGLDADDDQTSHKGEVHEASDHYFVMDGRTGARIAVSSFHIEPTKRIRIDEGELIEGDITCQTGKVFRGVRFPLDAWRSRRNFLRSLPSADMHWFGSDENVQGVLHMLSTRQLLMQQGTSNLGYIDSAEGPRWVSGDGVLAPAGAEAGGLDLHYVPGGASLDQRVRYLSIDKEAERKLAAEVLPRLLELNAPDVILPILGWFFAAPLRPRLQRFMGHFPILMVWGTQGSGKSSLILNVFWPLLGVIAPEAYSATETEFALLKLLSATNSVPVFIDEYKPFDMNKQRRNTLHRLMRRLYTGESEERGKADLTLVTYRLNAPLCLAGETRPIEPALVERILPANPEKDTLLRHPEHQQAFQALRNKDLSRLGASIIRFLLGRDTRADLDVARKVIARLTEGRELPPRVRDNLEVMALGLVHFEEYAEHLGIKLPDLDVQAAITAILGDLLEGGGTSVKTGLDLFLEELSVMAVQGAIQAGREYVYSEGRLALHFPSCHAAYAEHCRRTGFEGEVPDRKALRRQLEEARKREGYVRELDAIVSFNGRTDRRRAVLIDLQTAKQTLSVDDFPVGAITQRPDLSKSNPSDDLGGSAP